MMNIKLHSFYNEFDSEMSCGELEVIADYLQDADYITAKSRKNFIKLFERMPQKAMVMLKGNDALDYICISKEPHTEKNTEKPEQNNNTTKLFRVEADGMCLNPENTDLYGFCERQGSDVQTGYWYCQEMCASCMGRRACKVTEKDRQHLQTDERV